MLPPKSTTSVIQNPSARRRCKKELLMHSLWPGVSMHPKKVFRATCQRCGKCYCSNKTDKKNIAHASFQAIDESQPFVSKGMLLSTPSLLVYTKQDNQLHSYLEFFCGSGRYYLFIEKEATTIIKADRKWEHLLTRHHFTLITDQQLVTFTLDNSKSKK